MTVQQGIPMATHDSSVQHGAGADDVPRAARRPHSPRQPRRRPWPLTRMEQASSGMRLGIALSLLPGIALFSIFFIIPLGVVAVTSLSDWGPIEFSFSGLRNYTDLFGDDVFWTAMKNTAFFAAIAVFVQVPVGVALALVLSRRIRGWRILRTVYFLPDVVSRAALALVFLTVFNPRYGLLNQALGWIGIDSTRDWLFDLNTALPAVAATWAFTSGIVMVLVMAEIAAIPDEVYDAAHVDGASRWQTTRHVTLPLLRHAIGICTILVLLATLAYFDGVYIMTGGGPANHTLTLSLYAFQQYSNSNWGYANAIGSVVIVLGVIAIVGVRRIFRMQERDL